METVDGTLSLRSGRQIPSRSVRVPAKDRNSEDALDGDLEGILGASFSDNIGAENRVVRPKSVPPPPQDTHEGDDGDIPFVDAKEGNAEEAQPSIQNLVKDIVQTTVKESLTSIQDMIHATLSQHLTPKPSTSSVETEQTTTGTPKNASGDQARSPPSPSPVRKNKISLKPPVYDGTSSWPDFLIQFEMVCELNEWTPYEKLLCLGASLKGVAQETLGDVDRSKCRTYDDLVQVLSLRYGPSNSEDIFKALLKNRTQQADETYPDMAHAIRRLVRRAYPNISTEEQDKFAKEHFIEAIGRADVEEFVCFKEPATLDEAVRMAIKVQYKKDHASQKSSCGKRGGVRAVNTPTTPKVEAPNNETKELKQVLEQIKSEMSRMNDNVANRGRREGGQGTCYGCGERGHMIRNCPHRQGNRGPGYHGNGQNRNFPHPNHHKNHNEPRQQTRRFNQGGLN